MLQFRFVAPRIPSAQNGGSGSPEPSGSIFLGGDVHRYVASRVSLFLGPRVGWFAVERATDGTLISHWNFGLDAGVSLDVASWSGATLFVRPEIDAALINHALIDLRTLLWGGGLGIGFRFSKGDGEKRSPAAPEASPPDPVPSGTTEL
jgi:hypothetical protein